jgi:hypothetical protein
MFYDPKHKIPIKILAGKRYGIKIIAEFCGIPSGFPNQVAMLNNKNGGDHVTQPPTSPMND